eukprot:IDg16804t1
MLLFCALDSGESLLKVSIGQKSVFHWYTVLKEDQVTDPNANLFFENCAVRRAKPLLKLDKLTCCLLISLICV